MGRFDQIVSDAEFAGKNNLAAVVAPTTTDDSASGYEVGSYWVDTVTEKVYFCTDDTATAAQWKDVTGGVLPALTQDTIWVGNGSNVATETTLGNNVAAATLSTWVLDAGTIYYQDITHNLNSDDVFVEIFDSVTKETVLVEKIDRTDLNTVRVYIEGNTASLRVVITKAVLGYVGSSGRNVVLNPTSPYTAQNNDIVIWDCTAGNKILNLPAAAASSNFRIDVKKIDASSNTITVDPNGAELIEGGATAVITTQYEAISTVPDGGAWWIIAAV